MMVIKVVKTYDRIEHENEELKELLKKMTGVSFTNEMIEKIRKTIVK